MARTPGPKSPDDTPRSRKGAGRRAGVNSKAASTRAEPPATGAAPQASVRDRIIDATMALAAERAWDDFDIREIASQAGVSLGEFRDSFPSKGAVLAGLSRRIDRIVLDGTGHELDEEPVRERLFDVMMRRLDALAPYKDALREISRATQRDPLTLAALNQLAMNSMRFMLAAAGIDTSGPLGLVKQQGAVLIWSRVLDTWLHDDDPGMARTMAKLDKELRRGGQFINGLNDLVRLSAPFRAIFDRAAEGGRRFRERQRASRSEDADWRDDDGDRMTAA